MKKKLDIEKWARKDHFQFFNQFEEPFFGLCVDIDCSIAYEFAKKSGRSFFLHYLHKSLLAANQTEPFRYRIFDGQVYVFDQVDATPTVSRPNGTFGYAYMEFFEDFRTFELAAEQEIQRIQHTPGLVPATASQNVIHYSSLPWVKFRSLSHARRFSSGDSCPKIAFGKMTESAGKRSMPVSIHVHHALMDGLHVGQYLELFQKLLQE